MILAFKLLSCLSELVAFLPRVWVLEGVRGGRVPPSTPYRFTEFTDGVLFILSLTCDNGEVISYRFRAINSVGFVSNRLIRSAPEREWF